MATYDEFEDELMHYGILGMHWGLRRWQNKDGSLTPAGVKHYNKIRRKELKEQAKREGSNRKIDNQVDKDYQAKMRFDAEHPGYLTDQEIEDRIRRLQRERTLQDEYAKAHPKSRGKQFTESFINSLVSGAGKKAADMTVNAAAAVVANKVAGNKINPYDIAKSAADSKTYITEDKNYWGDTRKSNYEALERQKKEEEKRRKEETQQEEWKNRARNAARYVYDDVEKQELYKTLEKAGRWDPKYGKGSNSKLSDDEISKLTDSIIEKLKKEGRI